MNESGTTGKAHQTMFRDAIFHTWVLNMAWCVRVRPSVIIYIHIYIYIYIYIIIIYIIIIYIIIYNQDKTLSLI